MPTHLRARKALIGQALGFSPHVRVAGDGFMGAWRIMLMDLDGMGRGGWMRHEYDGESCELSARILVTILGGYKEIL